MKIVGIGAGTGRVPPIEVRSAVLDPVEGIKGARCIRREDGKQQVTLLSLEGWMEACSDVGADLKWEARRAHLLVKGLHPSTDLVGAKLRIGTDAILEVVGEAVPGPEMDEVYDGLRDALSRDWRGGIICHILAGGEIFLDDPIEMQKP